MTRAVLAGLPLLLLAAASAVSAGPVGLADHACDTAVEPLQAECVLECDRFAHPTVRTVCHKVDSVSAWTMCSFVFGPVPACDPDTYKCYASNPVLDLACREVLNPALDRL